MDVDDNIPSDCIVHNLSYNATADELLRSAVEDVVYTFGLPVVIAVGFAANIAFLFVLFRIPEMRTVTNAYLGNIAAADLWLVTWTGVAYFPPYYLSPVRHSVYLRTGLGCGFAFGAAYFGYFASTVLITSVTVERYFAICRPFQHRLVAGKKHTLRMILFSWLTAVTLSAISLPSWTGIIKKCIIWPASETYRDFPAISWHCAFPNRVVYTFGEIVLAAPFFVVLPINIYMYGSIILTLSKRTDSFSDQQQTKVVTNARNQIARLLIVNGSVFLLCQAPYRILCFHYIAELSGQGLFGQTTYGVVLLVGRLLAILNSCCNPFIYYFTSSVYRNAFREAFCVGHHLKAIGVSSVQKSSSKSKDTTLTVM